MAFESLMYQLARVVAVLNRGLRSSEQRDVRAAIASAPELDERHPEGDVVCATGIVRAIGGELIAPLSSEPCVVYRARIAAAMWGANTPAVESFAMRPFVIDDRMAVTIATALGPYAVLDSPRGSTRFAPNRVRQFHQLHGRPRGGGQPDETIVCAGDLVSVVGVLARDVADDHRDRSERGFREAALEARLVGNRASPLMIRVLDRVQRLRTRS